MTYLQLVNEVLKRVRESQVGTVSASTYSALIASFINDAKAQVEDSWEWFALRTPVEFSLVAGTYTYDLSDGGVVTSPTLLNDRSVLMYDSECHRGLAWDITSPNPTTIDERPLDYVEHMYNIDTNHPDISIPQFYAVDYSAGTPSIRLYEKPSEVRDWRFIFKRPQDDLSVDSDELLVPWRPVVLLATNYALNEKGEEVGTPGSIAEQRYLQALSDAIALDSRKTGNAYPVFSAD